MRPARALLLAAIRAYRRHVSPRKGFACAYRVHAGGCSCSVLGLRAVSRYGAWRGLGVLRLRLQQCGLVAREHRARLPVHHAAQAGFVDCDLPCDASCIEVPSRGAAEGACEVATCLDVGDCDGCGGGSGEEGEEGESRQAVRRRRRRGDPVGGEPAPPQPLDET